MNFLKSVLGSGGLPGYTVQEKIEAGLYTLHNAIKREDNSPCSILIHEKNANVQYAKNYHNKLRSLKHPNVVKLLDSLETETHIYIATERIHPLQVPTDRDLINWGLYSIAQAIAFINVEATSVHGNIGVQSIYTTESGEWKLAGFECLTCIKDEEFIGTRDTLRPPGHAKETATSLDAYQFGALISTIYNGSISTQQGRIPGNMLAQFRRLLLPNPASRIPVHTFIEFGRRPDLFFRNELITVTEQISNLPLQSKAEVEAFLSENAETFAKLPTGFTKKRLLPEMIKSLEFGGGGVTALNAILTVIKDLPPADVESQIAPMVLRIWSSKDRATHLVMLEHLKEYITLLTPKQINDKLFPSIGGAFSDSAPIMRETAIRQVLILMPHLTERNINGELLKCLAKTANDQQPGIRTNTTICLGKIADRLSSKKVLTAAFSRSLKDPFMHARVAALQAITATAQVYDKSDLAVRLMPGITPLLIDPELTIRNHAKTCITELLTRLDKLTDEMPVLEEKGTKTESAGTWAGWAVSSLSRNVDSPAPTLSRAPSTGPSLPASTVPSLNPSTAPSRIATPLASPKVKAPLVLKKKEKVSVPSEAWGDWEDPVAAPLQREEDWDTDAW